MKCPECVDAGKTSQVYPGGASRTLLGYRPYYDEQGRYHAHDPNRTTRAFKCSEGHVWTEKIGPNPCGVEGCDFGQKP